MAAPQQDTSWSVTQGLLAIGVLYVLHLMELLGWLFFVVIWGWIYVAPVLLIGGGIWMAFKHEHPKNGRGEEPRYHGDGDCESDGDGD